MAGEIYLESSSENKRRFPKAAIWSSSRDCGGKLIALVLNSIYPNIKTQVRLSSSPIIAWIKRLQYVEDVENQMKTPPFFF